MILDDAIHVLALLGVIASLWQRQALFAASLIFFGLWYNDIILLTKPNPEWSDLVLWCALFAVKDLLFLTLLGFRRTTTEFIILLSFAVSCLFHQAILAQVLTYDPDNLTLFAVRPQFMMYVTVIQLATVFFIIVKGGGSSGGKRVKSFNAVRHFRSNRILHIQAFKAIKK